ncbi:MAG: hypothetical protein HRT52_00595 [Colwellia sp.]|nr:hypothetical protein [Colwellia sp.]
MFTKKTAIKKRLNTLIKTLKQKLLLQNIIQSCSWIIALAFITSWLNLSNIYQVIIFFFIIIIRLLMMTKSARYKDITVENLVLHLNRQYQQLEESMQLVFIEDHLLTNLQLLQKKRVIPRLNHILEKNNEQLIPAISYRKSFTQCLIVIAIGSILLFANKLLFPISLIEEKMSDVQQQLLTKTLAKIKTSEITVIAPQYTSLKDKQYETLNVEFIEGATIRWQLRFSDEQQDYFIKFADGTLKQLQQQTDKSYSLEKKIYFTGIYQIVTKNEVLENIYTLTVIKDKKPRIRIISPKKTITEIATNGITEFETQVLISDDFHISKVEILASIAKGSGESVKFRDQVFSFDSKQHLDGGDLYRKNWQLTSLGMEPGDELYFTIKAWDNHVPTAQMTRSATKIVRWVEEEEQGVLSSGILIDFMPEYFKSQRQIIIETIELIDDKKELSKDKFVETSELLGIAQSELKEKYGQYLGDEVEDGGGGHAISAEDIEDLSHDNQTAHDSSEENSGHGHENEHVVDTFAMNSFGNDRSGLSDNIARFGHNHGDADIGIMSRQDPKALMKRSISNMWQAELHLMLSEPDKALPFEQEALKYLKMAKKAERIYVKRLGFEPPPVSEQRRYQGELDDILSYQRNQKVDLTNSESKPLYDLFTLLNEKLSLRESIEKPLSIGQRKLIQTVKSRFEQLLLKRPALITSVAILERILLGNSFSLANCQDCQTKQNSIAQLSHKIWQILPQVTAMPSVRRESYADRDSLFKKYSSFLIDEVDVK